MNKQEFEERIKGSIKYDTKKKKKMAMEIIKEIER